jgi:hypothetical protein
LYWGSRRHLVNRVLCVYGWDYGRDHQPVPSPGKKASLLVFNNIKEISLCMRIPNEYNMSFLNIDEHKHKPLLYVYIFEILKFPLHIQTPFFETLSWGTVFSKTHKNPLRLSLHESNSFSHLPRAPNLLIAS